jgi:cytochrome P450
MSVGHGKSHPYHFDRHAPDYKDHFSEITQELHATCPVAWTETYDGHWVVSGYSELFEVARNASLLSNDRDITGERPWLKGISIPGRAGMEYSRGGFLEMDPPEQKDFRRALDPYLSPAAVERWKPMVADVTRACIDEKIESGRIDFVDDLANVVPAVMTMAMMGLPLADWVIYNYPAHAQVYTPPDSPEMEHVMAESIKMGMRLHESILELRENPRPGLVNALIEAEIVGKPATDDDIRDTMMLLVGGGFDTTTALTAHSLEWLGEHPDERQRLVENLGALLDSATEEFLRYYTPAPGDGRTVMYDYEVGGCQLKQYDRLWLSWAMANRDPEVFEDPENIHIDRQGNRHTSFGLGVHRCIGSNVARAVFKTMLTGVLERMPDYVCDPAGAVHYDTIGVIQGMKNLPATFTPGTRQGAGLEETIATWEQRIAEEGLAEPVVRGAKS